MNFIKRLFLYFKSKEIKGTILFLTLFFSVIILFVFLAYYTSIGDNYFYLFFIIALLCFIIDPFLKDHLPSVSANLLLLEIYLFVTYFSVSLSNNNNFFFIFIVPIISASMSFGVRGGVFTTLIIFFLFNIQPKYYNMGGYFWNNTEFQNDILPKFIGLFIIAIMLGFLSEEKRKLEQQAYERISKIVTLNEIKNSLKLDYDEDTVVGVISNSICRIIKGDAVCSYFYNMETKQVQKIYENNLEFKYISELLIPPNFKPELFTKKLNNIFNLKKTGFNSVLKLSIKYTNEKSIVIFIVRVRRNEIFVNSDIEVIKTLKVYIELILKNYQLYKQIDNVKNYMYYTFKNLPLSIIILDENMNIKFVNTYAVLILKYNDEKELINKFLGKDIYLFTDNSIINDIKKGKNIFHLNTKIITHNLETKQIELTVTKLNTEYDDIKGTIISFNDVTEFKALEDELFRREKLASLGQMSAGIAHELRNPLGAIKGFISILKEDNEKAGLNNDIVLKIDEGVEDLNKIVKQFLSFTSKIQINKENYNIIETLNNSILYIRKLLEDNNIELEKKYFSNKIIVNHDKDKMKQVLLNLFLNAVDAVRNVENPKIKILVTIKSESIINPQAYIEIHIIDNGVGISKKEQKDIFNPFFTTKTDGIGLGLSISQKIIDDHEGFLLIESKENEFTEFTLRLPVDERLVYKY